MSPAHPFTWTRFFRLPHAPDSRFAALDGYRALSALFVMGHHVAGRNWLLFEDTLSARSINAVGQLAVTIFFVMSGFLLYKPFVDRDLGGLRLTPLRHYFRHRLLRIIPAFWVALTGALLLVEAHRFSYAGGHLKVLDYVSLYALVQNYQPRLFYTGLPVAWTLGIELSFYLALPVIVVLTKAVADRCTRVARGRMAVHAGMLALLYGGAWLFRATAVRTHYGFADTARAWLFNYLDWFSLGMVLALAVAWRDRGGRLPRLVEVVASSTVLCWTAGVSLFFVFTNWTATNADAIETLPQMYGRFFWGGLIVLVVLLPVTIGNNRRDPLHRVLRSRPMLLLSTASYGMYLWHLTIIERLEQTEWWQQAVLRHAFFPTYATVVALSLLAGIISWYGIERTVLRFRAAPRPGIAGAGARPPTARAAPRRARVATLARSSDRDGAAPAAQDTVLIDPGSATRPVPLRTNRPTSRPTTALDDLAGGPTLRRDERVPSA